MRWLQIAYGGLAGKGSFNNNIIGKIEGGGGVCMRTGKISQCENIQIGEYKVFKNVVRISKGIFKAQTPIAHQEKKKCVPTFFVFDVKENIITTF